MSYTSKDYGLLFLGINQDVRNNATNKDSFHSTSQIMGRNPDTLGMGEGNPTVNKSV